MADMERVGTIDPAGFHRTKSAAMKAVADYLVLEPRARPIIAKVIDLDKNHVGWQVVNRSKPQLVEAGDYGYAQRGMDGSYVIRGSGPFRLA
jgi:hypothetical protein